MTLNVVNCRLLPFLLPPHQQHYIYHLYLRISSATLEVGNDVGTIFRIGDASEGHGVTGRET